MHLKKRVRSSLHWTISSLEFHFTNILNIFNQLSPISSLFRLILHYTHTFIPSALAFSCFLGLIPSHKTDLFLNVQSNVQGKIPKASWASFKGKPLTGVSSVMEHSPVEDEAQSLPIQKLQNWACLGVWGRRIQSSKSAWTKWISGQSDELSETIKMKTEKSAGTMTQ